MKKISAVLLLAVLLAGCGAPKDFETMSDTYEIPRSAVVQQPVMYMPEEAALTVSSSECAGSLYLCDGYTVAVQTLEAGNLNATLRAVTGYSGEELLVMQRFENPVRYECAWAAAGEGGDQVGRTVILDDGSYHYTLTLMCGAELAGELAQTWQEILNSFTLSQT